MVRTQHCVGTQKSAHISRYRDSLTHVERRFKPLKVRRLTIGLEALLGPRLAIQPTGQ